MQTTLRKFLLLRRCGFLSLSLVFPLLALDCMGHEEVILLHGLCRTKRSMVSVENALIAAGFRVLNFGYASRSASITALSESAVQEAIARCRQDGATRINFVTHSLGGILVRNYLARVAVPELGRVVMLAPPNQGSEVVDKIGRLFLFKLINGPAGRELGTGCDSMPNRLGAVTFPLGVIAGSRSLNWLNSLWIPGPDDGKVSIERTRIAGMVDHIALPVTHPFIMKNHLAIHQAISFLQNGRFDHSAQEVNSSR